jgi:hypothetical protein
LAVRPQLIAIAAISLAALVAMAASAQTPAPVTLSGLFDPDLAEIKPDAIGKLKDAIKKAPPGDCHPPRVTFKVVVAAGVGDPLFLTTLANARWEALAATLKKPAGVFASLGVDASQLTRESAAVEGNLDYVQVSYNGDDKDPPKLKVTSIPRQGTKVKVGDQINVTITASERYEDGHKSWPTGVYNIQLTDGDGWVKSENYGRVPQPCATPTFPATYTVPCKSTVHLTAIAEDAVGNKDSKVAEFYTVGVWHGTDENSYDITSNDGVEDVRSRYHELVTFDLCETSKDKLEGQAHATWASNQEVTRGKCAGMKTTQDPKTVTWDAHLTGSIQHLAGNTRFEFHATPDRGPPYKEITTPGGECTLGGTQEANQNSWDGFTFSLKQGEDHYDFPYDAPLGTGDTGQHHQELHVKSSGK